MLVRDHPGAKRWFGVLFVLLILSLSFVSLPSLVPAMLVLLPVSLALQIASWVSAFRAARRSDRTFFCSAPPRFVVAGLLVLIAIFAPLQYLFWPLKAYVVEAFITSTASMSPTLVPGDRFLVHKLRAFQRFDIVLIAASDPRAPGDQYVRRIVGFPGETIEIKNGGVNVNGQLIMPPKGAGPYVRPVSPFASARDVKLNGNEGNPITLGPDEYFFLGDNSPIAGDSRYWDWSVDGHQPGTLPRSHIKGVATWIYFPPVRWRRL
ncbi:MAG: signal peptidase I [Anaerolineae bacterium]|nr:signal peptidase I [Phycisphaerae bacterium]